MKHFHFVFGLSIGVLLGVVLMTPIVIQKDNQLEASYDVILQVEQDKPEYFYDVLIEGDAWDNFIN